MIHKLTPSETVLDDDYPLVPGYVYIIDGVFCRFGPFDDLTVGRYKKIANKKEIRRCDLFAHEGARLGDSVEP